VDVQKQVDYWKAGSQEDIEVAEMLCEQGRFRHGLFFAHLAIEKMLKAHVTRQTANVPPKIHNLSRLAEMSGLSFTPEQSLFLRDLGTYQIEGRYPETLPATMDRDTALTDIRRIKELTQWLIGQL
jgi:HEPN domain-containing protein